MDKTIGIFGGGQLGRMMAQAALPLNIQCIFFETNTACPSAALGPVFSPDKQELNAFIENADVFSLEFENTPLEQVDELIQSKNIHPSRQALAIAQNRLLEKNLFKQLEIPVAPFIAVNSRDDLHQAVESLGLPIVLKTATGGYDGKGQFVLRTVEDIAKAWADLGHAKPLIAESFVHFSREVSIIAVRGQNGDVKTWPLAENHHHQGILSHSIVPAPNSKTLQPTAEQYISTLLQHLNYVGVLTLELFVTDDGLYANEMAPRVHNSGHWSIEGAVCSQFENHIRAVAGLPLGSTEVIRPTVMVNIIGKHPNTADVLSLKGAHLHLYNKSEREGRKLGHITLMPIDDRELPALCHALAKILPEPLSLTTDMSW
ncbi:5-(carboxyamino)imidazole ribonucleotide synthase [Acinetobacter boissieri]|uniref:N5-carboxyaminoimidazole ribonucleotide synthase n=1 Tax=Acinetobacter boissieri TaxID=1219383 RepID=A0A1G6K2W3_9GAMM|nr:5-(carboxyamino)imidazole ribonucleotide synthase [Acinetobacter boissieri]SDC25201.1 5-(carboxyamino)imidazole ribonucleotide synthase [Acinetobacter boissieri]